MTTTYLIPCGGEKLDRPAAARELYTSSTFRLQLAAAEALVADHAADGEDARVLIVSALHGLVELDTVVAPYDVKMGQRGSVAAELVAAQATALGIEWGAQVYGFLPRAYFDRVAAGLDLVDVWLQPVYEAAPGIGYQRGVAATVATRFSA